MKPAYFVANEALNSYRTHYDNLDPHWDGDDKTVADFVVATGVTYGASPTTITRVLMVVGKYANVLDPDIYNDDALYALKKAKRDLR